MKLWNHIRPLYFLVMLVTTVAILLFTNVARSDSSSYRSKQVIRRGIVMGLDPGFSLRVDETGTPLYVRLDLRIGGCLTPKLQLGADWRMDLWVGGGEAPFEKRHEIGPVMTFFIVNGLFARVFAHLGGYDPWLATAGGQLGYEFSTGRFSAIGFALGGDADIPFNGQAPTGYAISAMLYLSAYDLASRKGRDF